MKIVRRVSFCLACFFTVICMFFSIGINMKYPKSEIFTYDLNQEVEISDYSFIVDNFEVVDYFDFKEIYDIDYSRLDKYVEKENIKVAAVTVVVENTGMEDIVPQIYQLTICSGTYSNGVDLDVFKAMNNDSSAMLAPLLRAGESIRIVLPYVIYGTSFQCDEGDPFMNRDFDLIFSIYPQKIYVNLT